MSSNMANENAEKIGEPKMIFLPSETTTQEFSNLTSQTKTGVTLTGSSAMGTIGPTIGLLDIAECVDSFYFRVSLPGVSTEKFSCKIDQYGNVLIKGVSTTGEETVIRHNQVFKMLSQNLCPPGHFTITFQLPGPVNIEDIKYKFGSDGILEAIVKKYDYGELNNK